MISHGQLKDLSILGLTDIIKHDKDVVYEDWVVKLFEQYFVTNDDDKRVLSVLIENINSAYLRDQEIRATVSNTTLDFDFIKSSRYLAINELIYYYTNCFELRKFIPVRPITQPAALVPLLSAVGQNSVVATAIKGHSAHDVMENLQTTFMDEFYKELHEPEVVKVENLRAYLKDQVYSDIIYNNAAVMGQKDDFNIMVSSAAVIDLFENFKKNVVKVKGYVRMDEILLRKDSTVFDFGACLLPFLMPFRAYSADSNFRLKEDVIARCGRWIGKNVNDFYKRVIIKV